MITLGTSRTEPDLRGVIDLVEAAQVLGIGRTMAYRLVREGRWPTPVIRLGRLIKVPVAPLEEYLCNPHATVA